jgi:hypothetical protein
VTWRQRAQQKDVRLRAARSSGGLAYSSPEVEAFLSAIIAVILDEQTGADRAETRTVVLSFEPALQIARSRPGARHSVGDATLVGDLEHSRADAAHMLSMPRVWRLLGGPAEIVPGMAEGLIEVFEIHRPLFRITLAWRITTRHSH